MDRRNLFSGHGTTTQLLGVTMFWLSHGTSSYFGWKLGFLSSRSGAESLPETYKDRSPEGGNRGTIQHTQRSGLNTMFGFAVAHSINFFIIFIFLLWHFSWPWNSCPKVGGGARRCWPGDYPHLGAWSGGSPLDARVSCRVSDKNAMPWAKAGGQGNTIHRLWW